MRSRIKFRNLSVNDLSKEKWRTGLVSSDGRTQIKSFSTLPSSYVQGLNYQVTDTVSHWISVKIFTSFVYLRVYPRGVATQTKQEMLRQVIFPVVWERIKTYAGHVDDLRRNCSPHCRSIFAHFLYFSTFFMFGMSVGMAGPTLTDYLISFFENIDIIDALAWLLFTQSTFRFLGAIASGFIVDRWYRFFLFYRRLSKF